MGSVSLDLDSPVPLDLDRSLFETTLLNIIGHHII